MAGTGEDELSRSEALASEAVGRALSRRGYGLVTGGWVGVDKRVTQSFAAALQAMGTPLSKFLKQIVPRPDEPAFFGGEVIYVEKGVPEWVESVRRADAVILIGGGGGTYRTYQIADTERVPVFPIAGTGTDAALAYQEICDGWEAKGLYRRIDEAAFRALAVPITSPADAEGVVDRALDLLAAELGDAPAPAARAARPRASPSPAAKPDKKRERADFLFITALPEERDALLRKLPGARRVPPRQSDIYVYFQAELSAGDGAREYRLAILPLLGMGRVNAATAATDAIKRWRPKYVVLVGIAGGIAERQVAIGDLLISEQIVDYELQKITERGTEVRWAVHKASRRLYAAAMNVLGDDWTKRIDEPRLTPGRPQAHIGPIASGDKVIAVGDVLREYRSVWPSLIGVEMEAAGVATACFAAANQPEFFMVRGVSDLADAAKGSPGVEALRAYACDVAAAYAVALLESRPVP